MLISLIAPDRPYLITQKSLPPLGPLYLANTLKSKGYDVEVVDFADSTTFSRDADVCGVTILSPDFIRSKEILRSLKRNGAKRVIAGGPHAAIAPEECLKAGFDGVSIGDGELTIERLINGEKIVTAWAKNIDDFYPDRSAIDLWDYEFYVRGVRATSLITSRGCWWAAKTGGCSFCCRCDGRKLRFNSAKHVKKELVDIQSIGFEAIVLYDDTFFSYPKRDTRIVKDIRELGFTWRCFSRADVVLRNKKVVEEAVKTGLSEVLLGVESASDSILKTINKGFTKKQVSEAINFLYDLGVDVKVTFIVGCPSESEETLMETKGFLDEHITKLHDVDFTILQIYPGCDIWREPSKFDLVWQESNTAYKSKPGEYGGCTPISTSSLSFEELLEWRDKLEKLFKPKEFIR